MAPVFLATQPIEPGVNVRAILDERLRPPASICAAHDAVLEINAHCRQDEMTAIGAGQALLRDPADLRNRSGLRGRRARP